MARGGPYWRGGGNGIDPGNGGYGAHMGFVPGPSMAQIPPSQASYGVLPMPHMIPMLHPMQMQYGLQYTTHGMAAVPMQYGHAPTVQMQPQLVQQAGGGWVPIQPAFYPGDMQHQAAATAQQMQPPPQHHHHQQDLGGPRGWSVCTYR